MIILSALKEYLKVDEDETADDLLILEIEQAAIAYLQNETGRYWGPIVELTETLSGNGWAPVWLQADPITQDDADYPNDYPPLALELRSFPNGTWSTLEQGTGYEVDGGRLYPLTYWTPGRRTLRAVYWAGFEDGEAPADIQQAVRELCVRMYDHRSPVVSGTVVAELPFSVREIIRAHRVPTV